MDNQTTQPTMPAASALLGQTVRFYRTHIKTIIGVLLAPFILSLVGIFISYYRISTVLAIVIYLLAIIVSLLSHIALLDVVIQNGAPQGGVGGAYSRGLTRFFSFLWISILCGLTVWGGIALFIIPGIYLSLLLSTSLFVLVAEQKKGLSALAQSWSYVKGHWWAVLGKILFLALIMIIVSLVVGMIGALLGLGTASFKVGQVAQHKNEISLTGNILNTLVQYFVFSPINVIYVFFIYQSLKALKTQPLAPEEEKKTKRTVIIFSIIGILAVIAAIVIVISSAVFILSNLKNIRIPADRLPASIQVLLQ